ncbi:MAG: carbamoyltransferase HypF [Candidatus Latescibacteria bacterium]|nr:carbamoyltransferase HypF [bacterium]MBD3425369.1 carbamoyltransferase HypF [Candidatus Latescibacterota bacterium]
MKWEEAISDISLGSGRTRLRLIAGGRVQGVGFRPTVYRYAVENGLAGSVINSSEGVVIEVEGSGYDIDDFGRALAGKPPPLAVIESLKVSEIEVTGESGFSIDQSRSGARSTVLFPVDTAVCGDCLAEMRDPGNRRYHYPFINCTNCGPRFTIIENLPYDRPLTTMKEFEMDRYCSGQYSDPMDRRFHAEPISCPGCGPVLKLMDERGKEIDGDPVAETVRMLQEGAVAAIKGLGGYHLSCLAVDADAVEKLRARKKRPVKPFALMFRDMEIIRRYCLVSPEEEELLCSSRAPIVLLRKAGKRLPGNIAPGNSYIGAFLPYTPLHHLLLEETGVLVMTSANFTDEPLISTETELEKVMGKIADIALTNNRKIAHKCDDSVFFVPKGRPIPIRRARGYVPEPVRGNQSCPVPLLALGGQEKGTFALSREDRVFISSHMGDLGDIRSQENFRYELDSFRHLLEIEPEAVACDMHPDYFTTRLAGELGVEPVIRVQHHHAHAVSVMAEYGLEEPALAVIFDGTGYGANGKLWGGEFLLAGYRSFRRLAHIKNLPLPGGEMAVVQPWRMALVHLRNLFGDAVLDVRSVSGIFPDRRKAEVILNMAARGINAIPTSSIGRLFDAVSFLLCGIEEISFEAEAAIALEALALEAGRPSGNGYPVVGFSSGSIDPAPLIEYIIDSLRSGVDRAELAFSFHMSIADMVAKTITELSGVHQCRKAVFSGGVFQNRLLCELLFEMMESTGIDYYFHRHLPPNDAGVSFGQQQVAAARIASGEAGIQI